MLMQIQIARANFSSSFAIGNALGHNNLLSFLALPLRDFLLLYFADAGRRNGDNAKVPFALSFPI